MNVVYVPGAPGGADNVVMLLVQDPQLNEVPTVATNKTVFLVGRSKQETPNEQTWDSRVPVSEPNWINLINL